MRSVSGWYGKRQMFVRSDELDELLPKILAT